MSNLQRLAHRCPVMSKALAVQSARVTGTKRFTSSAAGAPGATKPSRTTPAKRSLHSTGGNGANMSTELHKEAQQSMARETCF
jgi:5-aminolevulinate synthase